MSGSANRATTGRKGAVPKSAWKPGQSGNPKGAPRRGESWAEIIKRIGEMSPAEAAAHCKAIAGQLKPIGDNVTLKEAVVLRVYAALLFEPDSRLFNSVVERAEGKVAQPIDVSWRAELEKQGVDASTIFERIVATAAAALAGTDGGGSDSGSTPPPPAA